MTLLKTEKICMKRPIPTSNSRVNKNPSVPSLTRHDFNNLAQNIQDFLEQVKAIHQNYFVKRDRFNPIDELAFDQEWKRFYQEVVGLEKRLKKHAAFVKQMNKAAISESAKLFDAQVKHYREWCKQLRYNYSFNKQAALLETLLPHKQEINPPHSKLCCCKHSLKILVDIFEDESLRP